MTAIRFGSSRFRHRFSESFGLSFRRYVLWRRLRLAAVAMMQGADATSAAHAAGFADQSSWTATAKAAQTSIGRATLYKYVPGVQAILMAWRQRQVGHHLRHLAAVRDQGGDPDQKLQAVLEAFALISHQWHGGELGRLHRGEHVAWAVFR